MLKDYWNHVLWSDETKINLFGSDGVKRVWQQPGEEYKDKCVLPTVKHGGGSVMVWGCMNAAGTGELQFIEGPFSLRGVLTFVASGLDINGCVLSYFEGTANLHCYTSCTLITLHCSKVSFLQCCHMKRYNKIFTKNGRGVLTSVRYCILYIYINLIYFY